jgi:hypothetical protein
MRLPASWHQVTRVAGVALAAAVAPLAAVALLAAVAYGAGATASASSGQSFGGAARIAVGAAAESLISPPDRLVAWHGQVPRGSSDRRPGT